MPKRFNLAMGQLFVEGGQSQANLDRAIAMIHEARRRDCELIVLPECMDIGWTHDDSKRLAQPIPGPHADRLRDAARSARIHVAAGLVERDGEFVYNAAILIGPDGEILLKHRKINELDIAHHLYSPGDRLGVARTALGTIGLNICADNFPDSQALAHSLARMGAQIIVSPSAWAVSPGYDNAKTPYGGLWEGSYTTLAKLYDIPIVGVSNVGIINSGPWKGHSCIGCSLAVGADGTILEKMRFGVDAQELKVVSIELRDPKGWGSKVAPRLKERGYSGI